MSLVQLAVDLVDAVVDFAPTASAVIAVRALVVTERMAKMTAESQRSAERERKLFEVEWGPGEHLRLRNTGSESQSDFSVFLKDVSGFREGLLLRTSLEPGEARQIDLPLPVRDWPAQIWVRLRDRREIAVPIPGM
ncbi:hypothetical protein [Streptomyces sp. NBC_00582]|uniref:hypothetical protein n=1 Tax=Streptomyces sp. NBC_00582 TaxID=2975783 RepID=UPI0010625AE9|nr:hypothetical protein [Streptomyces sp. NBC_00582]WUB64005.1 hypothetical protein OG852_28225 [Streptomyces sp. NBC_00582]